MSESDAQSSSSFGSGFSGSDAGGILGSNEQDEQDVDNTTLESSVYSVLYTVNKDRTRSWFSVVPRLFLEWLQLWLVIVNPQYGWSIPAGNKWWQAFSFIQLYYFFSVRGYTFYLICMYFLAVAVVANLGLGVWLANTLRNNNCQYTWPIMYLRYFGLLFFEILDICLLTVFLITLDCQYFGVDKAVQGFNQEFPDVYCWAMPHLIHVVVVLLVILVFLGCAALYIMSDIELNPVGRTLMSIAHTKVEVVGFVIRMWMVLVSVFIPDTKWMSVMQLLSSFLLCYQYLKWIPHQQAIFNHIRIGGFFSVFWAALLLTVMSYYPGLYVHDDEGRKKQQDLLTILLWVGFVPFGLLGAFLSWKRTQFFLVTVVGKFRDAPPGTKARRIHQFSDAREVEIVSRCCRVWVEDDVVEEEASGLAERVIKAGVATLPHHPYMAIWWSSYLIEVEGSYQMGYAELQNAKKSPHQTLLERYCLYVREQDHTQKSSAASGGENGNVDLVTYVEFQRNYKLVLRLHYDALFANRTFWETLLHHNVTFDKMARAVEKIESTIRAADRMYKQVLSRHSNSIKILVLYVKFLQGVRNDPWSAARWTAEVEKMQRAEEEANERTVFGEAKDGAPQNHDDSKGIIIMGANSLIRMINEPAAAMFGYNSRAEVVGKHITLIVPPPFARNHNTYVRNYIQTGQAKILNRMREFVALHKDRYVVPISVYVTKVSGVGEDSVFMGIFDKVPPPPNCATIWVMNGGLVLSCDSEFTDWLGFKHEDLHAKPASEFVTNKLQLEELFAKIKTDLAGKKGRADDLSVADPKRALALAPASAISPRAPHPPSGPPPGKAQSGAATSSWSLAGVELKHMYLDLTVHVDMHVTVGGIGDTSLYVCRMHRKADATPCLLVTDAKGRISHVTSKLAGKLGVPASKLQSGGMLHAMDYLLPAPYSRIHHQWYRDKPDVPPAWSCRSGLSMFLNAMGDQGACVVPFTMDFRRKEIQGRDASNVVLLKESSIEQALDERRLALTLNSKGIVTKAGNSPAALFGFDPQALLGSHLSYVVDVLRPALVSSSPSPTQLLADEEQATKMLFFMAERSYDTPGMSWRCGITAIMDPVSLVALGPIGMAMMAKKMVPAVLLVEGYLEPPTMEGARVLLPSEMQLKVELWRSDLLSGVVEVDTQGAISSLGVRDQPVFSPHRILGLPPAMLTGTPLANLLPLHGKPLMEALFTEGGLAPAKAGGRGTGTGGRAGGRGGLRNAGQFSRRRGVGPLHTVKLPHGTDGSEVELQVQAVVKQDMGAGCSLYVHLHVAAPRVGRKDFKDWLLSSPMPAAPLTARGPASRRASAVLDYAPLGVAKRSSITLEQPKEVKVKEAKGERRPEKEAQELLMELPSTPPKRGGPDSFLDTAPIPGTINEADLLDVMGPMGGAVSKEPEAFFSEPQVKVTEPAPWEAKAKGGVQFRGTSVKSENFKKKPSGSVRSAKVKGSARGSDRDDDSSVDSDAPGLKEGGRDKIKSWITDAENKTDVDGGNSEAEEEEEEVEEPGEQAEQVDEDDREDNDLDEASSAMNDYKRGKRLKKLAKILLSPQSQSRNVRLKWVSMAVVLVLVIVDLAMFVTFLELVNVQKDQVMDLRSSAKAVNRVMSCCIAMCALQILLGGRWQPSVRHLGMGGVDTDTAWTLGHLETTVADMETYHDGVYRGFAKRRQLPEAYGLRDIWDKPTLPIRVFYEGVDGTFSTEQEMGLWDAGNFFIKGMRNVLQTIMTDYGINTNRSALFINSTDVSFALYNGPRAIMTSYQATLDGLMQQAIDDSQKMNDIQLVILAIEGGLIGTISVIVIWVMASKLLAQRFAVFSIFMTVPTGIIRALATTAFNLEEGGDEEQQEGQDEGENVGDAAAGQAGAGSGSHNDAMVGDLEAGGSLKATTKTNAGPAVINVVKAPTEERPPESFWSKLAFWQPPSTALPATKRRVQTSLKPVVWLAWPFIFWAVFVVMINAIGYITLKNMAEPIAVSNVVQFVAIRANRVQLFSMRLTSELYFDPTFSFTAAPLPPGVYNPLKTTYKTNLQKDYDALKLEYATMLYGHDSAEVANQTTPHFELVKKGIMFSKGASIMYDQAGCLARFPSDCFPPDHPFYRYVMNGVDQMFKQYQFSIESLLQQPDDDINMHSEYFKYIFEVSSSDIYGALIVLTDIYTKEVITSYDAALMVHIVAFSMCCGLGLLFIVFIMRPQFNRVKEEARRCAELFAQLPADVAVEAMLGDCLRLQNVQRSGDANTSALAHAVKQGGPRGSGHGFGSGRGADEEGHAGKTGGRSSAEFRSMKLA